MSDEEILESKKKFCDFLRSFADNFEKTNDIVRASMKIAEFFSVLESSSWGKLAQFVRPLLANGGKK